ncbi:hypothetical protein C8R47DRAFT_1077095 [Mycena vitilis]|nr:hypothetical protein C8R47DRAFT_1077095 [Mycena vitilis]
MNRLNRTVGPRIKEAKYVEAISDSKRHVGKPRRGSDNCSRATRDSAGLGVPKLRAWGESRIVAHLRCSTWSFEECVSVRMTGQIHREGSEGRLKSKLERRDELATEVMVPAASGPINEDVATKLNLRRYLNWSLVQAAGQNIMTIYSPYTNAPPVNVGDGEQSQRKAKTQLEPGPDNEEQPATRRSVRSRQTVAEAAEERQKKRSEAGRMPKAKPSWKHVDEIPAPQSESDKAPSDKAPPKKGKGYAQTFTAF